MKRLFVDSSVIIEYQKENKNAISLLKQLNIQENLFYINPIIVSEVAYILKKKLKYNIKEIAQI